MPLPLGRPHPLAQEVGSQQISVADMLFATFVAGGCIRVINMFIVHGLAGFAGATTFGAAPGTQLVPFTKTQDTDSSTSGGPKTTISFNHISAMKPYESKSPEELRWEDYQVLYSS